MAAQEHPSGSLPPLASITRRVVAGQLLFSTGHVLSTGGFLYYFANEFHPSAMLFAILQVIPEVAESAGLLVRPLLQRLGGRKRTWIVLLITARLMALGVPAMSVPALRPPGIDPFWVIIACVAVWYACQGLSFVAYLSWLSDLAPERQWGRFFAARQMSTIAISLVVPVAASLARDQWLKILPEGARDWSFAAIFIAGGLLALASIVPLLKLPDVPVRSPVSTGPSCSLVRRAFSDESFRMFLIQGWWLSAAQGFSQAAIFKYQVDVLHIPLSRYYLLTSVMLGLQLPLAALAGRISDRYGDRRPLFLALMVISPALVFHIIAQPPTWYWLFGAYALWGLFGVINVCGQNLALRLAPPSDNTIHLALFRQIGGLLAGVFGLCGGLWLDSLLKVTSGITVFGQQLGPHQLVFLVSILGRVLAPVWLLGVEEPQRNRSAPQR